MKDFESLVNIWNEQKTSPTIDYREVLNRFKKSRNKFSLKIWIELIIMLFTAIFIAYVWINMSFDMWTTHISFFILEVCCFYYIFTQIKNLNTLSNNSFLETPEKHINYLESFRKSRHLQNTRNYLFYTLVMGLAVALYFIELFKHFNTISLFLTISFTIIWFLICFFIIQKVYIKKEEKRFNELFEELERLKKQFTEE
jgi:membrane protein YdbS with pleckstrin-like domain